MTETPPKAKSQLPVRADFALIAQLFSDYDNLLNEHRKVANDLKTINAEAVKQAETLKLLRGEIVERTVLEIRERSKTIVESAIAQVRNQSQSGDTMNGQGTVLSAQGSSNLLESLKHSIHDALSRTRTQERNDAMFQIGVGIFIGALITLVTVAFFRWV